MDGRDRRGRNIVAYLLLPGERTAEAEAVYRKDPEWVVPILCLSEPRRVLTQYLRRGAVSLAEATRTIAPSCSSRAAKPRWSHAAFWS